MPSGGILILPNDCLILPIRISALARRLSFIVMLIHRNIGF